MSKQIKHSVIVVTYNQENLLPIALDSVFSQSVLPYEIIIGDDCSTDGTWEVIQKYYEKYPSIIRPIRHEKNKGIFGNINFLKSLPKGDVVSFLSGDDYYYDGIFETYNKTIIDNNIDLNKECFILISNCTFLHQNGTKTEYNNTPYIGKDLFKIKIRYGLDFRDTGMSVNLIRKLDDIPEDLGYHADWLHAIGEVVKADNFYFINKSFSAYRIGSGVTSIVKQQELFESKIKVIKRIKELYKDRLDNKDILFLDFDEANCKHFISPSFKTLKHFIKLYIKNRNNFCSYTQKKNAKILLIIYCRNYILKKTGLYNFCKTMLKIKTSKKD